ncbi:MAG: hypothetical protein DRJ57_06520 [Thermoprotei archaeon]|nr:MAG: hypothetical protein DRJ57_06520 [Thermoprotei archaeon]
MVRVDRAKLSYCELPPKEKILRAIAERLWGRKGVVLAYAHGGFWREGSLGTWTSPCGWRTPARPSTTSSISQPELEAEVKLPADVQVLNEAPPPPSGFTW